MPPRPLVILLTLLIAAGLAWRALLPPRTPAPLELTGTTMGGTWSVKLRASPASTRAAALQSAIAATLARLDGQMSNYNPASDLSRFNASRSTDWLEVPPDFADVAHQSLAISTQSAGAFDVTIAPLVNLWGFGAAASGPRTGAIPTDAAIAAARSHVDYHRLEARLDPPALRKSDPQLAIDLGAIAKGYAADAVAKLLDEQHVPEYLIAVGGELRAKGAWRVGIEVPAPDTRRVLHTLTLANQGLSTSGDYRNFVELNHEHFSHEIDPRTGRPVDSPLASVSVVHPSNTTADAIATALFVLGPQEGFALATRLHLPALFVTRDADHFTERATPEFERLAREGEAPAEPRPDEVHQ